MHCGIGVNLSLNKMNYPIIEDIESFVYENMPAPPASYEECLYMIRDRISIKNDLEMQLEINDLNCYDDLYLKNSKKNRDWRISVINKKRYINKEIRILNALIEEQKIDVEDKIDNFGERIKVLNKRIDNLHFDTSELYELKQKTKAYENYIKDVDRKISELTKKLKNRSRHFHRKELEITIVTTCVKFILLKLSNKNEFVFDSNYSIIQQFDDYEELLKSFVGKLEELKHKIK